MSNKAKWPLLLSQSGNEIRGGPTYEHPLEIYCYLVGKFFVSIISFKKLTKKLHVFFLNTTLVNEVDFKKKRSNIAPYLKGIKAHSAKTSFDEQLLLFIVMCSRNKDCYRSLPRGRVTMTLMATILKPLTLVRNLGEISFHCIRCRAANPKWACSGRNLFTLQRKTRLFRED